jgi:two-component system, NtrC family, response regulator AlgB
LLEHLNAGALDWGAGLLDSGSDVTTPARGGTLMAKLLIVDDEKGIRLSLVQFFDSLGFEVSEAESGAQASALLAETRFDLVLTDFRMAEMNGLELLDEARRIHPDSVGILMTAYATVESAVAAIKAGVYDYVSKPFSLEQIRLVVERAIATRGLVAEHRALREVIDEPPLLVSRSPLMEHLLASALQAALSKATVLLVGENGTGKHVIARQIHQWSPRRDRPFIVVNSTTLSEHQLERELFGHVRGAFAGAVEDRPGQLEVADGGTVFLDEIADLSDQLQSKCLRFVQEQEFAPVGGDRTIHVDARIIAASNHDLEAEVTAQHFREDLFYRLNVITLRVPALRERREDILPLAEWMLKSASISNRRPRLSLSPEAAAAISNYQWPGNVRELRNSLERAALLTRGEVITPDDLPDSLFRDSAEALARIQHARSLEEVERDHIARVIGESATLQEAAATLGINVATLWRTRYRVE